MIFASWTKPNRTSGSGTLLEKFWACQALPLITLRRVLAISQRFQPQMCSRPTIEIQTRPRPSRGRIPGLVLVVGSGDLRPSPKASNRVTQNEKGEQRSLQIITDRLRETPANSGHSHHDSVSSNSQESR